MASALPAQSKMPVPRLPLEIVLTAKDGSTPRQPLTCGSDRSCITRANPTNTLPDTPGEGSHPRSALPLPPLPIGAIVTRPAGEDPQNTEPWSPQSLTGFCTPRNDLSLDKLTLASPRSGSLRTPLGSPMMSPHSPKSPSMMSPMRLVGTRSPCSIKLSGGSSTRLGGRDGVGMRTSGGTAFTSPRGQQQGNTTSTGNNVASGMRPVRKPNVSRALPFTQPTPAAQDKARQTKERFQIPHLNGRELSFSDLLDPTAKDRAAQRLHQHTTGAAISMPLSFVNAVGGFSSMSPSRHHYPVPTITTNGGFNSRGGIPTSPVKVSTAQAVPSQAAVYQQSADIDNNGQATPRKRPRKNNAPQRADFGNDDTCGGGGGNGASGSMELNDSSHGETSGGGGGGPMTNTRSTRNTNTNNNNNNNGFGSMTWEDGGHTSPLKKSQHATSTRRNNNNGDDSGGDGNGGSGGGVQQRANVLKRDHQ